MLQLFLLVTIALAANVALLRNNRLWCGGSILTKKWILTAAHCSYRAQTPLTIRSGSSFWAKGGNLHQVETQIIKGRHHPQDLAVMSVTEPFVFDETCKPIPLFLKDEKVEVGTMAVVSGWGLTEKDVLADQLLSVEVPIVDHETCNTAYNHTLIGPIVEGQICAGFMDVGGKDSCQGDSGGPMVVNGRQVGIVSTGNDCALPKYPGVYIDVAYYHDWIMEQIKA